LLELQIAFALDYHMTSLTTHVNVLLQTALWNAVQTSTNYQFTC